MISQAMISVLPMISDKSDCGGSERVLLYEDLHNEIARKRAFCIFRFAIRNK